MAVFVTLILRGFVLIPVQVEGNSMENTLKQGDSIVMEKFTTIKRFDVVVFQLSDGTVYIKRVIGLPGDTIEYKNDQLKINGEIIEEPFLEKNITADTASAPYTTDFTLEELTGEKVLPKDNYFVMGDNRRVSKDSRSFGTITRADILGKARFVYYPISDWKYIS